MTQTHNPMARPKLTANEKIAGKRFRAEQQEKLTALMQSEPPTFSMPTFISHQRHECPARNDVSTAIELKEVYEHSPAYFIVEGDENGTYEAQLEEELSVGAEILETIPAGRFGFWYKDGKCRNKGCHATVRSPAGVFVDAYYRPPMANRVSR